MESYLDLSSLSADQPNPDTDGMSYADIFRHYLAPEVAKLPASASPRASTSALPFAGEHPFDFSAPENPSPFSGTDSFSPTSFLPTNVPGSPIGAFSPSSSGSGEHAKLSPLSFTDLDVSAESVSEPWSIDPSFFSGTAAPAELSSLSMLPALPDLPVLPTINEDESVEVAPAAGLTTRASAASKHRRAKSTTVEEEEDEAEEEDSDEDMDSDDSRGAPSAAKKRKASSSNNKKSVAGLASATLHSTARNSNLPPVPEWADRPDPEAYKKLNSKEKRQLRNKISARNFRHRRKEYITTLEDEISSRDTIITQLRDQVDVIKGENTELKSEVTLLKAKWDEMLSKLDVLNQIRSPSAVGLGLAGQRLAPSPAAAPAPADDWALDTPKVEPEELPSLAPSPAPEPSRRSNRIPKPNLSKDIAPSARRSAGNWATAGFGGGYTSVHTTLLPEVNLAAALSPKFIPPPTASFNPALNNLSQQQLREMPSLTSHLRNGFQPAQAAAAPSQAKTFQDFFASSPFALAPNDVESYRASLYGKVAHNAAGLQAAQKDAAATGGQLQLPSGFRPAFFTAPVRDSPAAGLSGKAPASRDPSPADFLAFQAGQSRAAEQQTTALVAGLATQTLLSSMAGAFVSAFAGKTDNGTFDGAKVADVLSGKAKLEVVPSQAVRPQPARQLSSSSVSVDSLGQQLGGLQLAPERSAAGPGANCLFTLMMDRCKRPGTPSQ